MKREQCDVYQESIAVTRLRIQIEVLGDAPSSVRFVRLPVHGCQGE